MSEQIHTIKYVSNRTGLSQHTIRAWERRYGALTPERTDTNRRLYSTEDLEKLMLLGAAVSAGHSIGRIAHLSIEDLRGLVAEAGVSPVTVTGDYSPLPMAAKAATAEECVIDALEATAALDSRSLEDVLARASADLGSVATIDRLVLPMLRQIGEEWRRGELRPAQEHLASAAIRSYLGRLLSTAQMPEGAPRIVVSTPAGMMHELGALVAAIYATAEGWNPVYLGANLPAEEIAGAALRSQARAIALSVVFAGDDGHLLEEMQRIRRYAGPDIPILVGGARTALLDNAIHAARALYLPDMVALRHYLAALRGAQPPR